MYEIMIVQNSYQRQSRQILLSWGHSPTLRAQHLFCRIQRTWCSHLMWPYSNRSKCYWERSWTIIQKNVRKVQYRKQSFLSIWVSCGKRFKFIVETISSLVSEPVAWFLGNLMSPSSACPERKFQLSLVDNANLFSLACCKRTEKLVREHEMLVGEQR